MIYSKNNFHVMRTIDKLLTYSLSQKQKSLLTQAKIINWVWGEWQNLDIVVYDIFQLIKKYWGNKINVHKLESLWADIHALSIQHDVEFFFKLWFYRANFRFAKNLFYLTHWIGYKRFILALWVLIILNRKWKKFYFTKK